MSNQLTPIQQQNLAALQNYMPTFEALLNNDIKTKKFMIAAYQIANDAKLGNCTSDSIIKTLHCIAELGLSCSQQLGQAYLIPYSNNLTLQIGKNGYKKLMAEKNMAVETYPVFTNELKNTGFTPENGISFEFHPDFNNRNDSDFNWVLENFKGIIYVLKQEGKVIKTDFVGKSYIEKARLSSPNQKGQPPSGIWQKWYIEMAEKTAIKYGAKKALVFDDDNDSLATAIRVDDNTEEYEIKDITPTPEQSDYNKFIDLILNAETVEELKSIGSEIKNMNFTDEQNNELRVEFSAAMNSMKKANEPVPTDIPY